MFAPIPHIDCVLEHIKDAAEFKVVDKGDYIVINYMIAYENTFTTGDPHTDSIRRECRGLVFNRIGQVISRPYHKFFNVGELEETQIHNIDLSKNHLVLEKLDGSMVRPIPTLLGFRLGTKAGITEVSMNAEVFVAARDNYESFISACIDRGVTPIFEWCSNKNRIVIDYQEDRLVLTAIRNNLDGSYFSYDDLKQVADFFGLDLVRVVYDKLTDIKAFESYMATVRSLVGEEGVVLRFDDGTMYKIKADDYVTLHKSKDLVSTDLGKLKATVFNTLDDLKPILSDQDYADLKTFHDKVVDTITTNAAKLESEFNTHYGMYNDKRDFAVHFAKHLPPVVQGIMFDKFKYPETSMEDFMYDRIKANLTNQKAIDKTRILWDYNYITTVLSNT